MCRLATLGGRCAGHTRPAFEAAAPGTPEWDSAARNFASTKGGRSDMESLLAQAEEREDLHMVAALTQGLRNGAVQREATEAAAAQIAEAIKNRDAARYRAVNDDIRHYIDTGAGDWEDPFGDLADADLLNVENGWVGNEGMFTSEDGYVIAAVANEDGPVTFRVMKEGFGDPLDCGSIREAIAVVNASRFGANYLGEETDADRKAEAAYYEWKADEENEDYNHEEDHDEPWGSGSDTAWGGSFVPVETTMAGMSWNSSDPTFNNCTPDMPYNQFVNTVCDNVGVTSEEFNAAAAEYMSRQMTMPTSTVFGGAMGGTDGTGITGFPTGSADFGSIDTRLTPQEIAEIAQMAKAKKDRAAAREAAQSTVENKSAAGTDAPTAEVPKKNRSLSELLTGDRNDLKRAARHEDITVEQLDALTRADDVHVAAQAARNTKLPVERVRELSKSTKAHLRAGAARNELLTAPELHELAAKEKSVTVLAMIARNPSASPELYTSMATHKEVKVRTAAGRRADIPLPLQRSLSNDESSTVRASLANNRTVDPKILDAFTVDISDNVRTKAAGNHTTPPETLAGVCAKDDSESVRGATGRNPVTPVAALKELAKDEQPYVRRSVAGNRDLPNDMLVAFLGDEDETVREAAKQAIANRAEGVADVA